MRASYAEHYKAPRFESKSNRQGHHDTSGYRPKQDGAWEAPKNVHLVPASLRVGISLTPSRGFRVHHDLNEPSTASNDSSSRDVSVGLRSNDDELHDMHETGHHENQTNNDGGPTATSGDSHLRKFFSFFEDLQRCGGVWEHDAAISKPPEGGRTERRPMAGVWRGGPPTPTPAPHHSGGWWWWATHHTGGWPATPRGGRYA
jgi:hypothetical protein